MCPAILYVIMSVEEAECAEMNDTVDVDESIDTDTLVSTISRAPGEDTLSITISGEIDSPYTDLPPAIVGVGETTLEEALAPGPVTIDRLGGDAIAAFREARDRQPKNETLARLGAGAMGEVLVARDRDLNRIVAVKRIDPTHRASASDIDRFYTEAQITAQLDHPSIVPVYDINLDRESRLTYSMKLVRGITLSEYISETLRQVKAREGLDEDHRLPDRLEVFLAVCAAVAYAHSRGVIHRDLKPDNIMLGSYQEVVVMDWGIAKLYQTSEDRGDHAEGVEQSGAEQAEVTQNGKILGTPLYMSPEQACGMNEKLGPASDQASLGLILFELVSLRRAYRGSDVTQILLAAAEGKKRSLIGGRLKVPRELKAIIEKSTAVDPQDRYKSVQELANDVRRFVQNEEVQAAPDRVVHTITRWMSAHRGYTLAIVLGVLLVGLMIGGAQSIRGELALDAQRIAAEEREYFLSSRVGAVTSRADAVNASIDHWQAQLTGMAYAAQVALTQPPNAGEQVYDCAASSTAPGDMARSEVFFKDISASRLCVEVAPGVEKEPLGRRFEQVMGLSSAFRRARLASVHHEVMSLTTAEQNNLIRDEHLPILFSYMGTPEGIMATYPGRDTARDDYDARARPWYRRASAERGPIWMAIDSKTRRKGLVLTGAMAVRDPVEDQLLGVVAIDVEFTTIIDGLLAAPEGVPKSAETYLLSAEGEVILQSSMRAVSDTLRAIEADPFPFPKVARRFTRETSGNAVTQRPGEELLILWSAVEATGWTYVAVTSSEDFGRSAGALAL